MKPATLIHVAIVLLALFAVRTAHAGQVETLIDQLDRDSNDRIRLAAAVNLAKLGDPKAILPLAKALLNDSDKNVRGACAVALGVLVNPNTKSSIKGLVVRNLKSASENDASEFVKQQAQKALTTITGQAEPSHTGGSSGTGGGAGGIYVNIGPMSSRGWIAERCEVAHAHGQGREPDAGPGGLGDADLVAGRAALEVRPRPEKCLRVLCRRYTQHADHEGVRWVSHDHL